MTHFDDCARLPVPTSIGATYEYTSQELLERLRPLLADDDLFAKVKRKLTSTEESAPAPKTGRGKHDTILGSRAWLLD